MSLGDPDYPPRAVRRRTRRERVRVIERSGADPVDYDYGLYDGEVRNRMGIGVSVFLLAVGAILAWAVEINTPGVDLDTIGVILMIVGAIGLLFSLLFWSSFAPFGRDRATIVRDREIHHDRDIV